MLVIPVGLGQETVFTSSNRYMVYSGKTFRGPVEFVLPKTYMTDQKCKMFQLRSQEPKVSV